MAVMNTNVADTKTDHLGPVKVDLNDKNIPDGETQQVDQTADAYDTPVPPYPGKWKLKLAPDQDGAKMGYRDTDNKTGAYFAIGMECKILQGTNKGWKDAEGNVVFTGVSSQIYRGKKAATMATLLVKLGYGKHLKPQMSDKDLAVLFNKVLRQKEPTCWAEIDWKGYSPSANKTVYYHAADFGVGKDGLPNHSVQIRTKEGNLETITAKAYVVRWYSDADAQGFLAAGASGAAGAVGKPAAAGTAQPKATRATKAAAAPVEEVVEDLPGQADMFSDLEPGAAPAGGTDDLDDGLF
jgi:hypothetical protein